MLNRGDLQTGTPTITTVIVNRPMSNDQICKEREINVSVYLSAIVPIYNEEESIGLLIQSLTTVLDGLQKSYEIILVNDGSTDKSSVRLRELATGDKKLKVVEFRHNSGQTAALMAGIDFSTGEIIVTLDADLQNDPGDIPMLIEKLEEGYDVVSGWRVDRQDAAIRRNLVSRIANKLISRLSGVNLHDYGCTLKAYRREVLTGMRLYGEMHRFVPIYASWMGAKVVELPVRHHARRFGRSKYGLNRTIKVVLDLLVVKFFSSYLVKPIYLFGGFGLSAIGASFAILAYVVYLKIFEGTSMIQTPLPVLAATMLLLGVMAILMGLLAEITVRTYFESQGLRAYAVRTTMNITTDD